MSKTILLSEPYLFGNENKYIKKCIETGWVSSAGSFVNKFEKSISKYTGSKYAIACINGTSALHISLILAGVKKNDEVIVPTLTFVATINVVKYCNAFPIFIDCNKNYCLDLIKTKEFLLNNTYKKNGFSFNNKNNKKISAIIIAHVLGRHECLDELIKICKRKNIKIIEDAAESLGCFFSSGAFNKSHVGTVGDLGCLSFNGNKIITTGGGGMILTNNLKIAKRAKYLVTQSKNDSVFYVHNEIGYNYRLTNIQAAMGCAQLEQINKILKLKKQIYLYYTELITNKMNFEFSYLPDKIISNYWLNLIILKKNYGHKCIQNLVSNMQSHKIQIRPLWKLNHKQINNKIFERYKIKNAINLEARCVCLPSSPNLIFTDIKRIVKLLNYYINK